MDLLQNSLDRAINIDINLIPLVRLENDFDNTIVIFKRTTLRRALTHIHLHLYNHVRKLTNR